MKNMKNSFESKVLSSLENDKLSIQQLEKELNKLKMVSDSLTEKTTFFNNITREAKVLFTQLDEIGYAKIEQTNFDTTLTAMPTFILKWNPKKKKSEKENDILRLHNWIKMRAKIDTLQTIAK